MRLRLDQLSASLKRQLGSIYVIAGDEPLQAMQAADMVRETARVHGYEERLVLDTEAGFEWSELRGIADNLSLFARKRLLDLRLANTKLASTGAKALIDYASHPPADTLLLVQCGKLDRAALSSSWLTALDRTGVILQVWSLNAHETLQWIAARLAERTLKVTQEAVRLLAERAEGNLLAARQEIEKLSLLYGNGAAEGQVLDIAQIIASVADSARFNVFELADAALAGDCARAVRILHGLAAEDVKPALVLWSLAEQARLLAASSFHIRRGGSLEQPALSTQRQRLLRRALERAGTAQWEASMRQCARVDRIIKGQEPGNPWDELLNLTLKICGRPLFDAAGH